MLLLGVPGTSGVKKVMMLGSGELGKEVVLEAPDSAAEAQAIAILIREALEAYRAEQTQKVLDAPDPRPTDSQET